MYGFVQEFTLGMSHLVQGDPMDKLDLMFNVFDQNGNGEIELLDLLKFVKNESDELVEAAAFASEMIATLDTDGDGSVSKCVPPAEAPKHAVARVSQALPVVWCAWLDVWAGREEFKVALKEHPLLLHCFKQTFSLSVRAPPPLPSLPRHAAPIQPTTADAGNTRALACRLLAQPARSSSSVPTPSSV